MEKIWNQEYSLQEFLEPKNFKSYEELNTRMTRVLGLGAEDGNSFADTDDSPAPTRQSIDARSMPTAEADAGGEEDDSLSYFSKLADEA